MLFLHKAILNQKISYELWALEQAYESHYDGHDQSWEGPVDAECDWVRDIHALVGSRDVVKLVVENLGITDHPEPVAEKEDR